MKFQIQIKTLVLIVNPKNAVLIIIDNIILMSIVKMRFINLPINEIL